MFPQHNKITTGFVIQNYITLPNGTQVCQGQQFVAGDQVDYETTGGASIEVDTTKEVYCPFEMAQPKRIPEKEVMQNEAVPANCSTNLTYRELAAHIETMDDEQLDSNVTIHVTEQDEFMPCQALDYVSEDGNGVLDPLHPFLVMEP